AGRGCCLHPCPRRIRRMGPSRHDQLDPRRTAQCRPRTHPRRSSVILTPTALQATPSAAPPLVPAIGEARLTATAPANGHPAEWSEHVRAHGEPMTSLRSGQIINQLERTGVLGRGGAGFPLLIKMKAVADAPGRAVIVVNASEGEPAIWKDRT